MSIWLEIHCDSPRRSGSGSDLSPDVCATARNDHPAALVGRSLPAVAYRLAKSEAREKKWTFTRGQGWRCPGCQRAEAFA